jgi:hypothetical protein
MSNNNFISVPISGWIVPWISTGYIPSDETESEEIKDDRDGRVCVKCKDFYPYAISNQSDKSFICYGCRHGY